MKCPDCGIPIEVVEGGRIGNHLAPNGQNGLDWCPSSSKLLSTATPLPFTIATIAARAVGEIAGAKVGKVKSLGATGAAFQVLERDGSVYELTVRVKTKVRPLSPETVERIRAGIERWSPEERARALEILDGGTEGIIFRTLTLEELREAQGFGPAEGKS